MGGAIPTFPHMLSNSTQIAC